MNEKKEVIYMEHIVMFGAAGFIGTNLSLDYIKRKYSLTLVDTNTNFFLDEVKKNAIIKEMSFVEDADFSSVLKEGDIVYHLVSTTVPTTANQHIAQELSANIITTAKLLDACVAKNVKKIVFISSGGTVYGKETGCPLPEETPTYPINSYGLQKITIEKLLYLYNYMYGLDYRVIRLANPYGPYQRPNGILGAITTFTYKAIKKQPIVVYGDGSVVRDFIYIDDAIAAINKIVFEKSNYKTYNLGSGKGTSISEILNVICKIYGSHITIKYEEGRSVDVHENYLDISRFEKDFGKVSFVNLEEGIIKTGEFLKMYYN